jgi:hypothetical protein
MSFLLLDFTRRLYNKIVSLGFISSSSVVLSYVYNFTAIYIKSEKGQT